MFLSCMRLMALMFLTETIQTAVCVCQYGCVLWESWKKTAPCQVLTNKKCIFSVQSFSQHSRVRVSAYIPPSLWHWDVFLLCKLWAGSKLLLWRLELVMRWAKPHQLVWRRGLSWTYWGDERIYKLLQSHMHTPSHGQSLWKGDKKLSLIQFFFVWVRHFEW